MRIEQNRPSVVVRKLIPMMKERQCLAVRFIALFSVHTRRQLYMYVCVCVSLSFLRNLAETLTCFCGSAGKYFTHVANIECKLSGLTSERIAADIGEKLCRHYQLSSLWRDFATT